MIVSNVIVVKSFTVMMSTHSLMKSVFIVLTSEADDEEEF